MYVYIYTRSFRPLKKVAHATEILGKKEYLHDEFYVSLIVIGQRPGKEGERVLGLGATLNRGYC